MIDFAHSGSGLSEAASSGTSAHSGSAGPEPASSVRGFVEEGRARTRELERLGDEIARLSAHISAATYRLLCLIRESDEREGWHEEGFQSCAQWLSWRTGTAPGAAREKLRVARALGRLPSLSEALRQGKLSYSAARALTRVATPENEAELVEVARHTTAAQLERLVGGWRALDRAVDPEGERERHRQRALWVVPEADGSWGIRGRLDPEVGAVLCRALEAAAEALYAGDGGDEVSSSEARRADALGLVAEAALGRGLGAESPKSVPAPVVGRAERFQVVVHVEAQTLGEAAERTGESRIEGGPHVSAETSRRLACDAGKVVMTHDRRGNVLNVGHRTRTVHPALRRALNRRDGGCRFPGCASRYCDAHHLRHWADGGETKLENLALLCRRHHRLLHEEGWRVERSEGGELRFYRPDGRLLPRVPTPPVLGEKLREEPEAALEREQRGLHIDPWTPTPQWQGDRLDLDWALFTLYTPPSPDSSPDLSSDVSAETPARGADHPAHGVS